jgi:hypothetical protein
MSKVRISVCAAVVIASLVLASSPPSTASAADCQTGFNQWPAGSFAPMTGPSPLTVTRTQLSDYWMDYDEDPFRWGPAPLFAEQAFVDWGDGQIQELPYEVCPDPTITPGYGVRRWRAGTSGHTYATPGTFQIRVGMQTHDFPVNWVQAGVVTVTDGSTTTTVPPPPTTSLPDPGDDPPESCAADPVVPRPPTTRTFAGWTATFSEAGDDGLVAADVRLGRRSMAQRMSLPYLVVRTSGGTSTVELRPEGSTGDARVRLVDHELTMQPSATGSPAVLEASASWIIWWPQRSTGSCLEVEQSYALSAPRQRRQLPSGERGWCNPAQSIGIPGVEGVSQRFACARFHPIVSYRFLGEGGEVLRSVESPQRLHLRPGGAGSRAAGGGAISGGLFQDCDTRQRRTDEAARTAAIFECITMRRPPGNPPHPLLVRAQNPVEREFIAVAVRSDRQPGEYDNYHCVLGGRVQAPGLDGSLPIGAWGCPTCVHIHWRWGTIANYSPDRPLAPRYTSGRPMVASASQTVMVASSRPGVASFDPVATGWRSLTTDRQRIVATDQVFWYVGRSTADADRFFDHGGFFASL